MGQDEISNKYMRDIGDRALFLDTTFRNGGAISGDYARISVDNLAENGLYVRQSNGLSVGYIYEDVQVGTKSMEAGNRVSGKVTKTYLPDPSLPPVKGESVAAMKNIVNSTGLGNNDLKVVSYQTPVGNKVTSVNAIAISSQNGFEDIMDKLISGDATALKQNYVLTPPDGQNFDMSKYKNWSGISNFSGIFDGNFATISNIGTKDSPASQGLFKSVNGGTVQNLTLDNVVIKNAKGQGNIGGVAGSLNNGSILGCKVTGLDMELLQGNFIAGVVGSANNSSVDRSSSQGKIELKYSEANAIGIAGFIGGNTGTNVNITRSGADIDIIVPDDFPFINTCINGFLGHDSIPIDIQDCYATGSLKYKEGKDVPPSTNCSNFGFGHYNVGSTIESSYMLQNGTPKYWNESPTVSWGGSSKDVDKGKFTDHNITILNDENKEEVVPVWLFPGDKGYDEQCKLNDTPSGLPTLNIDAVNVAYTEAYEQPIYEKQMIKDPDFKGMSAAELEMGLRTGKYYLIKESPETKGKFDNVSWQTSTIISDDLYKDNDAQAQAKYDTELKKIQTKDKRLELEQKNIDTEYKALTTEQDSIKKVIDKNIETSFKIFS